MHSGRPNLLCTFMTLVALFTLSAARPAEAASESVLWNFGSGNDGKTPSNGRGLIMDGHGNLYGTTKARRAPATGTDFEVTPAAQEVADRE